MRKWPSRWQNSLRGRWTFRPVSNITFEMENEQCELNFFVIQFLTGHECFRKYLQRFSHDTFPMCLNGLDDEEDAERIQLAACCSRFRWPRDTSFEPNRLPENVLNSRILWGQYRQRMAEVMLELQRLEERRRNLI